MTNQEKGTVRITEQNPETQSVTFRIVEKSINGERDPDPRDYVLHADEISTLTALTPEQMSSESEHDWTSDQYEIFTLFDATIAWRIHTSMEGAWAGTDITIDGPFRVEETR